MYNTAETYLMGDMQPSTYTDELLADRSQFGDQVAAMTLTSGEAQLYQMVNVTPGTHQEAIAWITQPEGRTGSVTLDTEDAQTGTVLASTSVTSIDSAAWQMLDVYFVAPSDGQVMYRLTATGAGTILAGDCSLTPPVLNPPAQVITWGTEANDFVLPPTLGYTTSGRLAISCRPG